ncbi:MAG: STAS domain-containing protein [Actinomycetota bacterium]
MALGNRAFSLRGEIDISSVERLAEVLHPVSESEGDVILDLQGLEFADSAGLRELIRCAQRLDERGRLVLRRPTPTLQRFFDVTGLGRIPNVAIETADA